MCFRVRAEPHACSPEGLDFLPAQEGSPPDLGTYGPRIAPAERTADSEDCGHRSVTTQQWEGQFGIVAVAVVERDDYRSRWREGVLLPVLGVRIERKYAVP